MCLSLLPASAYGQHCPTPAYDEDAVVRKVHDGDTVWLADGRKVRLIGINAPELARDDKAAEAFAIEARDHLRSRLEKAGPVVKLVFGEQRSDRYQRSLAHVFLPDGLNLQADLIEHGLATASTFPPNTAFSDCYHRLEAVARCENRGFWAHASRRVVASAELDAAARGFHIVSGKVLRVSESSKTVWIHLDGGLMIAIRRADLEYFDPKTLFALSGQSIRVHGWLQPKKNRDKTMKFYMRIRHPSAILPSKATANIPKC